LAALKPASVLATKTAAKSVFMFSPFIWAAPAAPDHDSSRAIRQPSRFCDAPISVREHGDRDLNAQ
jgi:hypothetical protein